MTKEIRIIVAITAAIRASTSLGSFMTLGSVYYFHVVLGVVFW